MVFGTADVGSIPTLAAKFILLESIHIMCRVPLESVDLLEVGNSIHLEASCWVDKRTGLIYLMPIDSDLDIKPENIRIIDTDDEGKLKFLRQADVVECRLYEGPQRQFVKGTIKKSQAQIEPRIVWEVFRRDKFACVYCGNSQCALTFDHWLPKSLGGMTTTENGRTACRRCNKLKADYSPEEWLSSPEYKRVSHGKSVLGLSGM